MSLLIHVGGGAATSYDLGHRNPGPKYYMECMCSVSPTSLVYRMFIWRDGFRELEKGMRLFVWEFYFNFLYLFSNILIYVSLKFLNPAPVIQSWCLFICHYYLLLIFSFVIIIYLSELIKFPNDFRWKHYGLSRFNNPKDCIKVNEPNDPYSWDDNYLCRRPDKTNIGLEWSHSGPIEGMTCIKVK